MSDYVSFFLNAAGGVTQLECIEISHPSFSKVYRYVKNDTQGITAANQNYDYKPMSIKRNNVTNDLDQTLSITLADVDDELLNEVKKIHSSAFRKIKPECSFKIYRDDDLSEPMISMPALEIRSVSKDTSGLATFDAQAPQLNSVRTGRIYTIEEFPLLRRA
ncbi:DUF1833 family protein [Acinetobacter guillouiae]|uniref:DUF1833 family protein n=1 Tax=Acinetobacter guillouiae TaxID=106649 RepID=UPI0028ED62AE|nr:DUF1833 family protein [Acinetobacter guillouiae]